MTARANSVCRPLGLTATSASDSCLLPTCHLPPTTVPATYYSCAAVYSANSVKPCLLVGEDVHLNLASWRIAMSILLATSTPPESPLSYLVESWLKARPDNHSVSTLLIRLPSPRYVTSSCRGDYWLLRTLYVFSEYPAPNRGSSSLQY